MLQVKLVKSPIGNIPKTRATVKALGLRKINQVVQHEDNSTIRGMIFKVKHLLDVQVSEDSKKTETKTKAAPKASQDKSEAPKAKKTASKKTEAKESN